jgi:hypothetical protein
MRLGTATSRNCELWHGDPRKWRQTAGSGEHMAALRAAAGGGSGEGLNGSVMTHRARGDGASQAVSFGSAATATR